MWISWRLTIRWAYSKMKIFTLIRTEGSNQIKTWWSVALEIDLGSCWGFWYVSWGQFCAWHNILNHNLNGDVLSFLFSCFSNEFQHHASIQRDLNTQSSRVHQKINHETLLLRSIHTSCLSIYNWNLDWNFCRMDHDAATDCLPRYPQVLLLPV